MLALKFTYVKRVSKYKSQKNNFLKILRNKRHFSGKVSLVDNSEDNSRAVSALPETPALQMTNSRFDLRYQKFNCFNFKESMINVAGKKTRNLLNVHKHIVHNARGLWIASFEVAKATPYTSSRNNDWKSTWKT